jgi:hypothetical protein
MRTRPCVWVNEQDIVVSSGEINNPKTEVIKSLFDGLDSAVTLGIHELVELDGELPHSLQGSCRHTLENIEFGAFDIHLYQIDAGGRHL